MEVEEVCLFLLHGELDKVNSEVWYTVATRFAHLLQWWGGGGKCVYVFASVSIKL